MKENGLHIIQYWIPMAILVVLAASGIAYWDVPIYFTSYGPDPGLTKGLLVLGLMGFVGFLMLIYWLLGRRGIRLYPWLVWLHMALSLGAVLALCGGFCAFRSVSWVGTESLDLEPSVVGFRNLSRSVFWLVVGQIVGLGHLVLVILRR